MRRASRILNGRSVPAFEGAPARITHSMVRQHGGYEAARKAIADAQAQANGSR